VLEAEARARALAALHRQNLDNQLDQLSADQDIEQKLNEIKSRQQRPSEPPRLHEGHPHTAPLQRPQPQTSHPASKTPDRTRKQNKAPEALNASSSLNTAELERLQHLLETDPNL
jgi:hypothetical protein